MSAPGKRIEVMHGVNLDQLGRRDPLLYGTLTLAELEQQIDMLKYQKAAMAQDDYKKQLTDALIELARVQVDLDK